MKRIRVALGIAAALFLLTVIFIRSEERVAGLNITATTTMMQAAINDIGGERVKVHVLIPGGSCPGHYDIRPGDIRALKQSAILFTHGYEGFIPRLRNAAGLPESQVIRISVAENWQLPDVYVRAAQAVAAALSKTDAAGRSEYLRRLKAVQNRASAVEAGIRQQAQRGAFGSVAVICSEQQAAVLRWMGFKVVAVYGRPEEFTPSGMHHLVELGKDKKVELVVDNLQSGPAAGRQLARELGARHLLLSNFPGGFDNTETWERTVLENMDRIVTALSGRKDGK